MQINGGIVEIQHRQFALSRIPVRDVVGKRLFLAASADARSALSVCHAITSLQLSTIYCAEICHIIGKNTIPKYDNE